MCCQIYLTVIYIKYLARKAGRLEKKIINEKRKKISTYSPYYIGNTSHKNYVFVCSNTDHCKVDQGVHME